MENFIIIAFVTIATLLFLRYYHIIIKLMIDNEQPFEIKEDTTFREYHNSNAPEWGSRITEITDGSYKISSFEKEEISELHKNYYDER